MSYLELKGTELFRKADIRVNGSRPWDIQVHNKKFFSRLLKDGSIALGESYVDGWWDCKQIDQFVYRLLKNNILSKLHMSFINKAYNLRVKLLNLQSKKKAKKNVSFHYNLGNDLFEATLGKYMSYSCAYWKNAKNLDQAQKNKMDLICKKLKLKKGMNVLDIGYGWGGFAKFAADKYRVKVVGLTLSQDQYLYALTYCRDSNVEIRVEDYRDHKGQYDRVVCIEMMEHVGPKNHRDFMECVHNNLKKDGLFLLQSISTSVSAKRNDPWIDKYIFPGTVPLSAKQITTASEGLFYIADWHDFTEDYHKTMLEWHKNFKKNWKDINQNYDEQFYRLWEFYLLCCPATALAKTYHLWQVVFARTDSDKQYTRIT